MKDRANELRVALDAVRAASRVCRTVQRNLVTVGTIEKKDRSPVTVADFASQAIVCQRLQRSLPNDPVVGEESTGQLLRDEMAGLLASVAAHVADELGAEATAQRVIEWINRGACEATARRYWTLDPIDGTKGFLRGEQYAVALALIEDGEVILGILGCPNLPGPGGASGALFSAIRDGRALVMPLWDESEGTGQAIRVAQVSSSAGARFCESVESEHSDQGASAQVARLLGITAEPYRLDSQCKYATVARGDSSIYLRMPTRKNYQEKIWDHAAGKLIVEAAGGRVTDVDGQPLDFHHGRTLAQNRGIVATCGTIHDEVLDAIRRVRD